MDASKRTRIKLVLYSHFFAPSIGGVESMVLSLASGLAELRTKGGQEEFDVTVVTQTPSGDFDDGALPFPVVRQPNFLRLWKLIRAADVVHIAGPSLAPLFLSRLARKPVALEHHGYQAVCPNGLLFFWPTRSVCPGYFQSRQYGKCLQCNAEEWSWPRNAAKLLLMFPRNHLARSAAANIAVSQHVHRRLALPRTETVYHGIEDALTGEADGNRVSAAKESVRFGYVGRFVVEKGVSELLEAAEILRREGIAFALKLIGDGPERPALEKQLAEAGLTECVRWTGFLSGPQLKQALGEVDALIMPTLMEETAGFAAMEQMIRGRLVIAADAGGLGEVVGDAGLKFRPGDAQALARAMKSVVEQPSIIESFGGKARERAVQLFQRRRMIEEHAAVYQRLAPSKEG